MSKGNLIAQVIVDNNSFETDRMFDYLIPTQLVDVLQNGMRVIVPFGKGNKRLEGYILNIKETNEENITLKKIIEPIDYQRLLSDDQIRLIFWMKNKYLCKFVEAIHCIIPAGIVNKEKKKLRLLDEKWRIRGVSNKLSALLELLEAQGGAAEIDDISGKLPYKDCHQMVKRLADEGLIEIIYDVTSRVKVKKETFLQLKISLDDFEAVEAQLRRAQKQLEVINYLKEKKEVKASVLQKELCTTNAPIKALIEKGYIEVFEKECKRSPFSNDIIEAFPKLKPSVEQQNIIDEISNSISENKPDSFLIHGITGSGKTEIYLQLMEEANKQGKQGIVLVPEISLTPQTVGRFRGRFKEGIAVFHSSLSEGERYDEWRRIAEGKVNMVIGARSAIFAPFKNLGLIIIDEEHENTYKSEQNPKYHAIEIANYRANMENAVVILGSATPSVESFYKAETGELKLMSLTKRAMTAKLPSIEIVDMKIELENGNKNMLSGKLLALLQKNIQDKKQSMLFLNRRGFSTFVSCRSCGHVIKCSHCDISLTFHMETKTLLCHYCGKDIAAPTTCPECSSNLIKYFGAGTQKLERVIQTYFPKASIARLDIDSTGKKGSHERILGEFKKGNIDILIGTQMITKGLDFPNVTLVGIISIDSTLNLPDFRASEKTFQLITQVSGRAGRGLHEGNVILQTYDPQHFSIQTAARHDYQGFYREELTIRNEFNYPPFQNIIAINISGKDEREVYDYSIQIAKIIRYILESKGIKLIQEVILGPNEAIIAKINEKYRYQIILKDVGVEFSLLKGIVKSIFIQHRKKYIPNSISVSIDINPYNLM
ncbi:primosomal protein N' [Alkaliphilus peptidifermentans]|uniref:Replication restart protein PriA n=1 Tax=Alkaliphilus peptidifermentans DSM 18978 TaxID=1120976 RepID=A0A1G5JB27_9FIRM|nr:primosomal protein N' [Alkaliphilus peptidifermentans]SCY85447.1 replication restart DNA helicase PriA [Alkaliphilus peptidifermentans DSM 18978]